MGFPCKVCQNCFQLCLLPNVDWAPPGMTHRTVKPLALCCSLIAFALAIAPLQAQGRSLEDLVRQHQDRLKKVRRQTPYSPKNVQAEMARQIQDLEKFVASEAKGRERYDGRFLLVSSYLRSRKQDKAKAALLKLDPKTTPPIPLLNGAVWCERLRLTETRGQWIEAALKKTMNFDQRMAVATFVMTHLLEVKRGEKIFADALASAKDDEQRARVMWAMAKATREREDLGEGAYEKALQKLGDKYPKTLYGSIAKDRLQAFDFKVGGNPIQFALTSLDGKTRKLDDYKGKVLLLVFWDSADPFCRDVVTRVAAVGKKYKDKGVALLGVSLDTRKQDLQKQVATLKLDWPQVFGGAGFNSEIALRYKVESTPYLLLIGQDQKIAAMNLNPRDEYGVRELNAAVLRAVGK